MSTTVIRNAEWAIAWNQAARHHAYRRDVDIAFADDRIDFVGPNYTGPADRVIDGKELARIARAHRHPFAPGA